MGSISRLLSTFCLQLLLCFLLTQIVNLFVFFILQNILNSKNTFLGMETEVKTETTPAVVEEDTQPEVEKQTNGEKNGNESAPASAETKKESSRAGKETREGTRSSRRERDRNNRTRRRSRSPVGRKSEDRPNKASRSVYVANFPFDVRVCRICRRGLFVF